MGLNSRNARLIKVFNRGRDVWRVNSKVNFKRLLTRSGILAPETYDIVYSLRDSRNIPWDEIEGKSIVIKPDRGYGGNGILVLRWSKRKKTWIRPSGRAVDQRAIIAHVRDILDGQYSKNSLNDRAIFEQMIFPHKFFRGLTLEGLSDIRVIVFNGVPIMSMLRVPTAESGGRANLHAGGLIIGIDIGSGVTQHAWRRGRSISSHPETNVSLIGLQIPKWSQVLEAAIETQQASGLGYAGIDIVIDRNGRVMVLEANAYPGLGIQLANMAGLQERVARVRNLKVRSVDHGIRVATELFSEVGDSRKKVKRRRSVVPRVVNVKILHPVEGEFVRVKAKADTGADYSSIDFKVAKKIGYGKLLNQLKKNHVFDTMPVGKARKLIKRQRDSLLLEELGEAVDFKIVRSASGATVRVFVPIKLVLQTKIINTMASVVDRSDLTYSVIVGAIDLTGFYVDPTK